MTISAEDRYLQYYRLRDEVRQETEMLRRLREACLRTGGSALFGGRRNRLYDSLLELDVIELVDRERALQAKKRQLAALHITLFKEEHNAVSKTALS